MDSGRMGKDVRRDAFSRQRWYVFRSVLDVGAEAEPEMICRNRRSSPADGMSLVPYAGPALTVGNELNKLASNIALGRDAAGVHYRSDGVQGILLGEAIALSILRETATLYNEVFSAFTLTRFDGRTETIYPYL